MQRKSHSPTTIAPLWASLAALIAAAPAAANPTFEYAHDDGSGFTEASLAQYDARVTWGNAFLATDPWTTITAVQVSFARDIGAGKPIQIGLWDDPTNDGDPSDAVLVTLADHVVPGPTGPEQFLSFAVDPTQVSGWFFVGVIADLAQGEAAMRQDFSTLGTHSWRFDNPTGVDNFDLGDAGYGGNLGDFGLGTWMVRAVAVPSPGCAALLGLGLLTTRRRRQGPDARSLMPVLTGS
ncbi:MAG: hypothetical protein ACI89L_002794 [Phycisphaerales bacterium]|jgi:hypothetical protein